MDEEKPKKKRKKKAAAADDGAGEHKRPWRENLATIGEIKAFVSDRYYLRYNVVRRGVECRRPSSYDHDGTGWELISDRIVNSLRVELSETKSVRKQDIWDLVESDFTPEFHPFLYYLDHLPPWDGQDYILELSVSVSVAGGVEKQLLFVECLKKWLVGMVAGWVDPMEVNHLMLVLVGRQGTYKTTWFNYILPPPLRSYFMTKTNAARMSKDDRLALTQYGLMCCEELDTMTPSELNNLKATVTMPSVDDRPPFGHAPEHRKHIASFCGTGNNVQFLTDTTGNRRWMPFEVERIDNPRTHPFNYAGIYAQAYALYQNGFQYWMEEADSERMESHTRDFRASNLAEELVDTYYRVPAEGEPSMVVLVAQALLQFGHLAYGIGEARVGRAFTNLGFRHKRMATGRGYYVVQRTTDEIESRKRLLAFDADNDG